MERDEETNSKREIETELRRRATFADEIIEILQECLFKLDMEDEAANVQTQGFPLDEEKQHEGLELNFYYGGHIGAVEEALHEAMKAAEELRNHDSSKEVSKFVYEKARRRNISRYN
jgi:hypothetical protein